MSFLTAILVPDGQYGDISRRYDKMDLNSAEQVMSQKEKDQAGKKGRGDVQMREVSEAKNVKGNVLSGSIVYQGNINPDGKYNLKSHSGRIEMILPSNSAFEFEAKTFSGRIESDFEISVSGRISKRQIQGVVNGGGATVTLKTFSGDIYLKRSK